MKTILSTIFFLVSFFGFGQNSDSLRVAAEVDSLIEISHELKSQGKFEKALDINIEAEKLSLEKLGRESVSYGNCCFNRSTILQFKGAYMEAEKWQLKSKDIREKALGKEHPDYAASLNSLAVLNWYMGNFEKAEPLYLEAKNIHEKVWGKEHANYAASLNNLALLHSDMGNFEKAEPLYLESKNIREKIWGKEHPRYANGLNNLATLHAEMGNFEKAEPFFLEAIAINEKVLGKEHPNYALSLFNLAILHNSMGNYEKAESLYLKTIDIQKKVLGKEHPNYALSLNSLGILYQDIGNYEKAKLLFLESMAIFEKISGKEHPDYALSLHNLAALFWYIGDYEKAKNLHLESIAIWEKVLGKEHPNYAASLNALANLYHTKGNYYRAETFYLESIAIREKTLGKEHPDYAASLNSLGILYQDMGNYEEAEPFFLELSIINKILMEKAVRHLSERELNSYLNPYTKSLNQTLSFAQLTDSEKVTQTCYDNSLFYKGFLLNAANQIKQLALSDSTSTEKYYSLKGYQRRLAAQYVLPFAERDSVKIAELEAQVNELEKDLARTVAGYSDAKRQVNWREVQSGLAQGEAAIEFVHFKFGFKKITDSTMYAALILRSGNDQPLFIPLFEEKKLAALLVSESKEDRSELFAQIYSRGAQPIKSTKMEGLYELIWKPMSEQLKGVKTVYYSPSGLLHRINFDAISIDKEKSLSDNFKLVQLGSTRSLVVPAITTTNTGNEAILYGGIEYEMDTDTLQFDSTAQDILAASLSQLSFSFADRSISQRGDNWNYLPGTEMEVSNINLLLDKSSFSSQVFSDKSATEESFKSIGKSKPSPRILHIATHGFFFPDPASSSPQSAVGSQQDKSVFKISDHPMIRSGLLLAGGNYAWKTGKPFKPDMEDGILTAYEISQMNLSNTELVVLSACETGLGDIEGNEGVYGLQRAFKIAGAKYLIMSLWQVPDRETKEFMVTFYRHWLEDEMTIPDAFRKTQREMKERFFNPYQWAGFVLVE